jgi:histidinol-phosphate aminotransferase
MADIGRPAKPVFESLLKHGVIIRSGHVLGMPNCVRVSVGTDEELEVFVEEFRTVMSS